MKQRHSFGMKSFSVRFLLILGLVLLTYNPLGYSLFNWLQAELTPLSIGSGLILVVFWLVLGRLMFMGSGWGGLFLGVVVIALLLWMAGYIGLLSFGDRTVNIIIAEVSFALLGATGLSWAHIRRRMTGQVSTDDIEADSQ